MMKKPEKCCIPDCFNCPYDDCMYSKLDKSDKLNTKRLSKWAVFQKTCLEGNAESEQRRNPEMGRNEYLF